MSDLKQEKREYTLYLDMMEDEDYLKVLLCENVAFINNGWWRKDWPQDHVSIHIGCNDVFAWGCADAEDVLCSELQDVYEHWKKDPDWGAAVWCIKKRKQMPQPPVAKILREKGYNLEELLGIDKPVTSDWGNL